MKVKNLIKLLATLDQEREIEYFNTLNNCSEEIHLISEEIDVTSDEYTDCYVIE